MKRDEILKMGAGREMDIMIERLVLGVNVKNPNSYGGRCPTCGYDGLSFQTPFYSCDIAAAWQVVEKFHDSYSIVLDYDDPETIEELKWCVTLFLKNEPYTEFEARAGTAPLAICRAALLSVNE